MVSRPIFRRARLCGQEETAAEATARAEEIPVVAERPTRAACRRGKRVAGCRPAARPTGPSADKSSSPFFLDGGERGLCDVGVVRARRGRFGPDGPRYDPQGRAMMRGGLYQAVRRCGGCLVRRLSFNQYEFDPPDSEQSLDLAASSLREHRHLVEFLAACGHLLWRAPCCQPVGRGGRR
jgi:hypothetical protein